MSNVTRYLPTAARVLFGFACLVFGLNFFFQFLPQPSPPPPESAMAFAGALMKTGYMFPLIKGTEIVAGVLLLSNRFVALALTVLAPIVVNIVAFHLFLAPSGIGLAIAVLLLEIYLAWSYRSAFRSVLAARLRPAGREETTALPKADARATA